MADDGIKCSDLVESVHGTVRNWDYTHDAIIVGHGSSGFKNWWLIRQSWGKYFGEDGYMRV